MQGKSLVSWRMDGRASSVAPEPVKPVAPVKLVEPESTKASDPDEEKKPEDLFVNKLVEHLKVELAQECDYGLKAQCPQRT